MKKFFFTFGTEGQPFYGGWVEIFAETRSEAIKVFRRYYPDKHEGLVNCSDIYTEEDFLKTCMVNGNFNKKCHAVLNKPSFDEV